jgi:hypothetical protein
MCPKTIYMRERETLYRLHRSLIAGGQVMFHVKERIKECLKLTRSIQVEFRKTFSSMF